MGRLHERALYPLLAYIPHPKIFFLPSLIMSTEYRTNTHSSSVDSPVTVGLPDDARPTSTTGPGGDFHPDPPSETVAPTEVDTPPQQGMS